MAKIIYAQNGVVVNVVAPAPPPPTWDTWIVDDTVVVSVGDPFDPKDPQIDAVDIATFRVLFRHENLIRDLIRALRGSSTQANNSANNEGLPTTVNSADMTLAQARAAFKALIP